MVSQPFSLFSQALGDGGYDFLVDRIDGQVTFNQDHTLGLAGGDLFVLLPHAAVELILLLLKAVFILAGLRLGALVAAAGAGQRGFKRRKKQEGEVGLKVGTEQAVEFEDGS